MRLAETRDLFASEFTFPVERSTVIERVGETPLEAPTGESESIADILEIADQAEYDSPDELFDALVTYVGDEYIGRKFYDDRGATIQDDLDEVSF